MKAAVYIVWTCGKKTFISTFGMLLMTTECIWQIVTKHAPGCATCRCKYCSQVASASGSLDSVATMGTLRELQEHTMSILQAKDWSLQWESMTVKDAVPTAAVTTGKIHQTSLHVTSYTAGTAGCLADTR